VRSAFASIRASIPQSTRTQTEATFGGHLRDCWDRGSALAVGGAAQHRHAAELLRFAPQTADADRWARWLHVMIGGKTMLKLHLDTDLGGDIDDLCALAMVLNWPDVELLAVTTNSDDRGRRAGYTRYALGLAGRADVAVAAGADAALGCYRVWPGLPDESVYWPAPRAAKMPFFQHPSTAETFCRQF